MRLRKWTPRIFALIILLLAGAAVIYLWGTRLEIQSHLYEPFISDAAAKYNLDPHLVRAVIWRESDFQPDVTGLAAERGLMQVTPNVGKEWAKAEKITTFRETDLFDPRTNIMVGSWYLSRAIKRWNNADQPEAFALAEYNAGRKHARRWAGTLSRWEAAPFLNAIDFPTTKSYVKDILDKRDYYQLNPHAPGPWKAVYNEIAAKIWRFRQNLSAKKRALIPPQQESAPVQPDIQPPAQESAPTPSDSPQVKQESTPPADSQQPKQEPAPTQPDTQPVQSDTTAQATQQATPQQNTSSQPEPPQGPQESTPPPTTSQEPPSPQPESQPSPQEQPPAQ